MGLIEHLSRGPVAVDTNLFTHRRGVRLVGIDALQLRAAAHLRSRYNVRTPDALQLAAAISTGCRTFVTNDRRLPAVSGLNIVQLNDVSDE